MMTVKQQDLLLPYHDKEAKEMLKYYHHIISLVGTKKLNSNQTHIAQFIITYSEANS